MNSGIYKITHIASGKVYVGLSKNLKDRARSHWYHLRETRHANTYLQAAYNKYGEDAFTLEIVEYVPVEKLTEREAFWISHYNSLSTGNGYNIQIPREDGKGYAMTEETKRKLSEALKGKKHSEESKQRMSLAQQGRTATEETKRKLSIAKTGFKHSEQARQKMSVAHTGYQQSADHVAKRAKATSEALTGRIQSLEHRQAIAQGNAKKVWAFQNLNTGEKWVGKNLSEFARSNNLNCGNLHSVSTGRIKQHKGWHRLDPTTPTQN